MSNRCFAKATPLMLLASATVLLTGTTNTARAEDAKSTEIIISHKTTRILESVNDGGTVNYLAALNRQYSEGVTPQNNAAVLLIKAAGPSALPAPVRKQTLARLGIFNLLEEGNYFITLYEYTNGSEEIDKDFWTAREEPWSAEQYPQLDTWLKANQKPLELVTKATHRPRYYVPLISADDPPTLENAGLPPAWCIRAVSEALIARAMLKLDSGDIDAARHDLLAVHRLARLIGQGPTLIEGLVACTLEEMACKADNTLATSGQLTASQYRKHLSDLQGLAPLPKLAEAIDVGERFFALDYVMIFYREGYKDASLAWYPEDDKKLMERYKPILQSDIDWNEVLRVMNSWYDSIVNSSRKPTFAERQEAFVQIYTDLKTIEKNMYKQWKIAAREASDAGSSDSKTIRLKAGRAVGGFLLSMWTPSFTIGSAIWDRAAMNFQMSQTALALAAYRAEQGNFPEDLAELCPQYFETVPENLFTGKPLDYRRAKKGYRLYSPGPVGYEDFEDLPFQIEIVVAK